MDQQATSQCVGREFVRQYYTVLHETPLDMHRFYTEKSSYLHGGDEQAGHELPPVCGQSEIYEKIKSLNFHSCHAKIRQVDSHMSVDDSVVIQVSGELSNNGERMRRFMQTFVLVQQSAKNYYVHNDIFRYQDQVFHSDQPFEEEQQLMENLSDVPQSSHELDQELEHQLASTQLVQDDLPVATSTTYVEASAVPEIPNSATSFTPAHNDVAQDSVETRLDNDTEDAYNTSEYTDVNATSNLVQAPSMTSEPAESTVYNSADTPTSPPPASGQSAMAAQVKSNKANTAKNVSKPTNNYQKQNVANPAPKVMSWAARASANSGNYRANYKRSVEGDGMTPAEAKSSQTQRDEIQSNERVQQTQSTQQTQQNARVPDNQQLFVGNIPVNSTELAIKKFFEHFGDVLSVKLNAKTKPNSQGVFAFVSFANVNDVNKILQSTPLKFDGQTLNIEQKKESSKKFNSSKPNNKPNNNKSANVPKTNGNSVKPANATNPSTRANARNKARPLNQRPKNGQLITAGGHQ